MRIAISERLKPYTHLSGTVCLLPRSPFQVQVFPALIRLYTLNDPTPTLLAELPLDVAGPVEGFTVQMDLERGVVRVWGETAEGFIRYSLCAVPGEDKMGIVVEKAPQGKVLFNLPLASSIILLEKQPRLPLPKERLSLGNNKAQDWQLVERRLDLSEILPLWLSLGQMTPNSSKEIPKDSLLAACHNAIVAHAPEHIEKQFLNLFRAGFHGLLAPRLSGEHQGYLLSPLGEEKNLSPLFLLAEGAALIRSLFFHYGDGQIDFLPELPPQLHCGRFLGVYCEPYGHFDFEWSKKTIRRIVFHAAKTTTVKFGFAGPLKQFRLRSGMKDRGQKIACGTPLAIEAGKVYWLDNFF